jgi:hypothetical protein
MNTKPITNAKEARKVTEINAKEARRVAEEVAARQKKEREKEQKILQKKAEDERKDRIEKGLRSCLDWVTIYAKDGKRYFEMHHPGEDIYPIIKKTLEEKGFRVNEFSTDEGYVIGDVHRMSVNW